MNKNTTTSTFNHFSKFLLLLVLPFLYSFVAHAQSSNETVGSGSYIIDMGQSPQTINNALKPYGLVYTVIRETKTPVKWVIKNSKTSLTATDFSHNGKSYKGGPFVIPKGYRSAAVDSIVNSWKTLYSGLTVDTTVSSVVVPVYKTLSYVPIWTLDAANGGISQTYLSNAGIPTDGYNWVSPQDLTCCNDLFVMPHADPKWATHSNLLNWNEDTANGGCAGWIWAACHAVSALENMTNPSNLSEQTNFLSEKTGTATSSPWAASNSLILWGDHDGGDGVYNYSSSYFSRPEMQFLDDITPATENGSEQIYIAADKWRKSTFVTIEDANHPDIPLGTQSKAAKLAFGRAFGDQGNGKVMYEAGHSHAKSSDVANIAAQRAFMNFSIEAPEAKAPDITTNVPAKMQGGNTYQLSSTAQGKTGPFTYYWQAGCAGSFDNPYIANPKFTPAVVVGEINCAISLSVTDACSRVAFNSKAILVNEGPRPPIALQDSIFCNPWATVAFNALTNDSDPDDDPFTASALSSTTTSKGVFTIAANGDVTYDPDPSFVSGTDTLTYVICDTTSLCDTSIIVIEVNYPDTDGDGIYDNVDIDDDNDGITDLNETGVSGKNPSGDEDSDGIPNYADETPGTGITWVDANSDGVNDYFDYDDDGIADHLDIDSDNDGIPDAIEANGGVAPTNYNSTTGMITGAVGANGLPDAVETGSETGVSTIANGDADGDGNKNTKDIDADNDGITDAIEANGGVAPTNYDANTGTIVTTVGSNGWPNSADPSDGGTALANTNSDADAFPNFLDIDSDNDGIVDNIEGQSTSGFVGPSGTDTDGDGWDDAYDPDNSGTPFTLYNHDGTDNPDYIDTDSDNDGVLDIREGHDNNSNGTADWDTSVENDVVDAAENGGSALTDADNDGLLDVFDPDYISCSYTAIFDQGSASTNNGGCAAVQNTDGTDDRDWRDTDDDNDGIPTSSELTDVLGVIGVKDYLENPCTYGQVPNQVNDTLYPTSNACYNLGGYSTDCSGLLLANGNKADMKDEAGSDSVVYTFGESSSAGSIIRTYYTLWESATDVSVLVSTNGTSWTLDTTFSGSVHADAGAGSVAYAAKSAFTYVKIAILSSADIGDRFRLDAVQSERDYLECLIGVDATKDSSTTYSNNPIDIDIQANDVNNTDTDPINISVTDSPNNGTVTFNQDGTVHYTPNLDFTGLDSFYYAICSDGGLCDTGLVVVNILSSPCGTGTISRVVSFRDSLYATSVVAARMNNTDLTGNQNMIGVPDELIPSENFKKYTDSLVLDFGSIITKKPLATYDHVVRIFVNDWANAGSVLHMYTSEDNVTYNPTSYAYSQPVSTTNLDGISAYPLATNYDVFIVGDTIPTNFRYLKFFITGAENNLIIDAVEVMVDDETCEVRIDAVKDSVATYQNVAKNIDVQANDINNTSTDTLNLTVSDNPSNGTVTINANGTLDYTPNYDFTGLDSFYYSACSQDNYCDTALVVVNIIASPCGSGDLYIVGLETDSVYATAVTAARMNNNDLTGNENMVGVPDELIPSQNFKKYTDSLVLDFGSILEIDPLGDDHIVRIFVNDWRDNASVLNMYTSEDNVTYSPTSYSFGIPASTTNLDGIAAYPLATNYDVYLVGDTISTNFRYLKFFITGAENNVIIDAVEVILEQATCTIRIAALNDNGSTVANTPVTMDIQANDTNNSATDSLNVTIVDSLLNNGSVTVNGNGTVIYTPSPNFTGLDSFYYSVCSDDGYCDTALVEVLVEEGLCGPGKATEITGTINDSLSVQISQSSDDAEQTLGSIGYLTSSDLEFCDEVDDKGLQYVGLRFQGITIPKGATITSSYIQFTVDDALTGGSDASVTIKGHKVANSSTFTTGSLNISNRLSSATTASVSWSPLDANWQTSGTSGVNQRSSDLSTIVEEIVGQGTWSSGNSMSFIFSGTGEVSAQSYDGASGEAAILVVNYSYNTTACRNPVPVAVNDTTTTTLNTLVVYDVSTNDLDSLEDQLVYTTTPVTPLSDGGTLLISSNGTVNFTPALNWTGTDSFEYQVCDTATPAACTTAWSFVTVANYPPVAVNDTAVVEASFEVIVDLFDNDSEPDNQTLNLTIANASVKGGVISVGANGQISFVPDVSHSGLDSTQYIICDGQTPDLCDTAWVIFNVSAYFNDPPVANRDTAYSEQNEEIDITVLTNDTEPESELLDVTTAGTTGSGGATFEGGVVVVNYDNTITYTPATNFIGTDSFRYVLSDVQGNLDTTTVVVIVEAEVNDPPIAQDDNMVAYWNPAGGGSGVTTFVKPFNNDYDEDGNLDSSAYVNPTNLMGVEVVTSPTKANVVWNATTGEFEYIPTSSITDGTLDSFQYKVCDDGSPLPGLCDTAWVYITMYNDNDAPVADRDNDTGYVNQPMYVVIKNNDYDPEGSTSLTRSISTSPTNGTASFTASGMLIYTPDTGFVGNDTVIYSLCDDGGAIQQCDTALVVLTVLNNNVIATPDIGTTTINSAIAVDILDNDLDPDGHQFWIADLAPDAGFTSGDTTGAATSQGGTVSINRNGTPNDPTDDVILYTPANGYSGLDTFWYQACDTVPSPNTGCATTYAVITIAENQNPVALDDEETTPKNAAVVVDVISNDYDLTGSLVPSTVDTTAGGSPSNGTLSINNTTGEITYTPNTDFVGVDTFEYTVCDDVLAPNNKCDVAIVVVTVFDQYTLAVDDDNTTFEDVAVWGDVTANDFDPESDVQTFGSFLSQDGNYSTITTGATVSGTDLTGSPVGNAGTLTFGSSGTYTFTPASGFTGTVTLPYEICDDGTPTACDTAELSIRVKGLPDPTSASDNQIYTNDDEAVSYGSAITSDALSNDGDPQGDAIAVSGFEYDSDGDGVVDATGTLGSATVVAGIDKDGNAFANAGLLTLNANGGYTFTPTNDFVGDVKVTYEACDDATAPACSESNIHIKVYADNGTPNDPPNASDDFATTGINKPVTASWIANDYDTNADSIILTGSTVYIDKANLSTDGTTVIKTATTLEGGTVDFFANGTYTYTPPTDYYGPDQVVYEICDKSTIAPQPLCNDATIYILVNTLVRDYGDLPEGTYADAWNVYVDENVNGIPEGSLPIWLGYSVSFENETQGNASASGDIDDGLIMPANLDSTQANIFKVIVNSTVPSTNVYFKLYFDWDQDGTFDSTYAGYGTTHSPDTVDVPVNLPSGEDGEFYARLRVALDPNDIQPTGGMNNGETEDYTGAFTPVPVELLYFEAAKLNDKSELTWATATEESNSHFEIQRSVDNQTWEVIGEVKGAGNSVAIIEYSFIDEEPVFGVNYYRLRQVDFNGEFEYSSMESVNFDQGSQINVYPNPAKNHVNIQLNGMFAGDVLVTICDMAGREMDSYTLTANDFKTQAVKLNVANYRKGYYLVSIRNKQKTESFKLFVR